MGWECEVAKAFLEQGYLHLLLMVEAVWLWG